MVICPNCRQPAPTVVRGVRAYCTACGAPRSLLEDTPVNVAGQPAKIGGGVAAAAGLMVLFFGGLISLIVGVVLQLIIPPAGFVIGGFLGAITLFVAALFLLGGRMLFQSGAERERGAHEEAIFAIARRRGGSVTPAELARVLTIPEPDEDAMLTQMAKRGDGRVTLELDDDGTLRYEVQDDSAKRWRFGERKRVTTGARVAPPIDTTAEEVIETQAVEEAREAERRMKR